MKQKKLIALFLVAALFGAVSYAHAEDTPVDENGVPLVNTRGGIDVQTRAELGDNSTFGERLRLQKEHLRATIEAKNADLKARVEEGREAVKMRIEEKKTEFQEKRTEVRANVEAHIVAQLSNRYTLAIKRLETLTSRIQARIDTLTAEGKDVSAAITAVANAKTSIATAQTEASAFASLGADAEISDYRTHAEAVKTALIEAKKQLMEAVRLLKGLSVSVNASASVEVEQ